jgi:oligopeptide/dipeptide ABC transporter ATP-binding protein
MNVSEDENNNAQNEERKNSKLLLEVNNLKTYFYTEEGIVKAVDGVSFNIQKNEFVGLVGETGCGKSVTALSILQLVRSPGKIIEGTIKFNNINLLDLTEKKMRSYRGNNITMIFQDPLNSLNPVLRVGRQISEVFDLHQKEDIKRELREIRSERKKMIEEYKGLQNRIKTEKERLSDQEKKDLRLIIKELKQKTKKYPYMKDLLSKRSENIIKEVGIADAKGILDRFPHELSGGMRQRIMISMGLSCNPLLLIADEPTTALDVTIQAQILELIKNLRTKFNTSILLITHDLGVIAETCDRVAVMYSGNIVENAKTSELFANPLHPYTKGLMAAIPSVDKKDEELKTIRGMVPNLIYPPSGCRFHPRCDDRLEICDVIKPRLIEIRKDKFIACHLHDPEYKNSPKYKRSIKEDKESFKV